MKWQKKFNVNKGSAPLTVLYTVGGLKLAITIQEADLRAVVGNSLKTSAEGSGTTKT